MSRSVVEANHSRVAFTMLGIFAFLTLAMAIGLLIAHFKGVPPIPATEAPLPATLGQAFLHLLTAAMKGMVALTGLEAMSNGIQFVKNEDAGIVKWGKTHLPRLKSGVGFLQRQIRHRPFCTDLIPVLRRPDDFLLDRIRHPF